MCPPAGKNVFLPPVPASCFFLLPPSPYGFLPCLERTHSERRGRVRGQHWGPGTGRCVPELTSPGGRCSVSLPDSVGFPGEQPRRHQHRASQGHAAACQRVSAGASAACCGPGNPGATQVPGSRGLSGSDPFWGASPRSVMGRCWCLLARLWAPWD